MREVSAVEMARKVRAGEWPAEEVLECFLGHIHRSDPAINAFTRITEDRARRQAREVDRKIRAGEDPGVLAGVPFAVKNLFDLRGEITVAGATVTREDPPAERDATIVGRLQDAGAVLLGALNMGEFAYDFTGENIHYGPSRNPHDLSRMTGGSSGGSGAAVAGGLVPLALGSDTNGSIRVPASLCGVFGLKPTFGRLSRKGCYPFCPSLDHVGPLARTVRDLALSYDVMQGHDPGDPVCSARDPEQVFPQLDRGCADLRIAVAGGYFRERGTEAALAAVRAVAAELEVRDEAEIPGVPEARAAAYLITNAESASLHLERLRHRAGEYDPDVRDRLLAGSLLPSDWLFRAQRFRAEFQKALYRVFERFDVLLAPATPMSAPPIGQRQMVLDGETMPVRPHLGLYTQPLSFVGLPVVVVPVRADGALPIGVQVVAAPWKEMDALRVAAVLEEKGFRSTVPQQWRDADDFRGN